MIRYLVLCLTLVSAAAGFAQKPDDIVATATGHSWKVADLSAQAQDAASKLPALMTSARKQLLSQYVGELLLETEAKARGISPVDLVKLELKKVKDPTHVEIK